MTAQVPLMAWPVTGLGEISAGDDLAAQIADATHGGAEALLASDVLVVSHKVVSKAEGRVVSLADVRVSDRARALADEHDKDPRHVQVILDETAEIVRARRGVLICRTHHGFICANAGVDRSNTADDDTAILLPINPDGSARRLRERLHQRLGVAPAVVIADSWGRPWRHGQVEVAIGLAGLDPLDDWRGRHDRAGRPLQATLVAQADQLAAAADLARGGKTSGNPVVILRGTEVPVTAEHGPGIAPLLRDTADDLFR